jgi:hypothetical protein
MFNFLYELDTEPKEEIEPTFEDNGQIHVYNLELEREFNKLDKLHNFITYLSIVDDRTYGLESFILIC